MANPSLTTDPAMEDPTTMITSSPVAASSPKTYALFTQDKIMPSRLKRETIEHLQTHRVLDGCKTTLKFCYPSDSAARIRDDLFYVFDEQFRLGLHFPVCPEMVEVLQTYGVILAQIMPHSIAGIMTFVIYLRRQGIAWSIDLFRRHFSYRGYKNGFVSFTAKSPLKILGLANKLPSWKHEYCRVDAPEEPGIPRVPEKRKVRAEKKKGELNVELDIRQYVMDVSVLKRMLYPGPYPPMLEEDWAVSDDLQTNRQRKDQHTFVRSRKAMNISASEEEGSEEVEASGEEEEEEEGEEEAVVVPPPRTRTTPRVDVAGSSNPLAGMRVEVEVDQEAESDVPSLKRRRKGEGVETVTDAGVNASGQEETSEQAGSLRKKTVVSEDGSLAFVNLKRDWYPVKGKRLMSEAHELRHVIGSPSLSDKLKTLSGERMRDILARCQMISWNVGEHYMDLYEKEKERSERLEAQLIFEKNKSSGQDPTIPSTACLITGTELFLKEFSERHNLEVAGYLKKIQDMEEEAQWNKANLIRGGVQLCASLLHGGGIIPAEWNDTERILSLSNTTTTSTAAPRQEESEKDGDSTTVG